MVFPPPMAEPLNFFFVNSSSPPLLLLSLPLPQPQLVLFSLKSPTFILFQKKLRVPPIPSLLPFTSKTDPPSQTVRAQSSWVQQPPG